MAKLWVCVCLLAGLAGSENPQPNFNASKSVYVIFNGRNPVCEGTAIDVSTKITLVTAAHCVSKPNALMSVQLGNAVFGKEAEMIDSVIIHPYYKPPSFDYDVAILKIKKPKTVKAADAKPLELVKKIPGSNDKLEVANWKETGEVASACVTVEGQKTCQAKLGSNIRVSSKMLCANTPLAADSRALPGGSPLILQNGIVGVASSAVKVKNQTLPRIFTNFANSEIYTFIEKYI